MTTLEEAKAFLQKEAADGTNLYDHLSDVLLKILVERPENVHETFETISTLVKQQRYVGPQESGPGEASSQSSSSQKQAQTRQEKYCNTALKLLKLPLDPNMTQSNVADLSSEANLWEWAGLGFSKGETFRLSLAFQGLYQTNKTKSLRFWGKILGRGADYYIAEGEFTALYTPHDPEAEEDANGVNKFTYWAMKDNGTYDWVQLPQLRRDQILAARQLCRYVQHDLTAPVGGHPPFPGVEKDFLRAQIARISAGTMVCPAGSFEVLEGEVVPAATLDVKTPTQLLDLANWTHLMQEINARYGRMTPMPPRINADGDEEPRDEEPMGPPLRALSEDDPLTWRLDRQPATLQPSVGEVVIARSLVWPGAVCIATGKTFCNVYVGHGVKFRSEPYQLPPPQRLQTSSGVRWDQDPSNNDEKPILRCEMPVEQPDVLDDPSLQADEDE